MKNTLIGWSQDGIKLECSWLSVALFCILFFTTFNGFYDSLNVEYGCTDFWYATYLGDPDDLDADLVKGALSLSSGPPPDIWDWSAHYQKFYWENPYKKMELVTQGKLTVFGVTPLTLLLMGGLLNVVLWMGPGTVSALFYGLMIALLGVACWCFVRNWGERLLAFVVLVFSYPFMMMLTRGNFGAAIVGVTLFIYIYLTCRRSLPLVAAICLAIACNVRPNAILLAPLFLCYGLRWSIYASLLFLTVGGAIAWVSFQLAAAAYPGYSLQIFLGALQTYTKSYVYGPFGDGNNNSLYGAMKTLYHILVIDMHRDFLSSLNKVSAGVCLLLIVLAVYKFWRGRLPVYYYAFAIAALYILGTSVFTAYHLLVLYPFILLAGGKPAKMSPCPVPLVFMAAALLIPKAYIYFFPNVSCEVLLNPLILLGCVAWIMVFPLPKPETVRSDAISTREVRKSAKA